MEQKKIHFNKTHNWIDKLVTQIINNLYKITKMLTFTFLMKIRINKVRIENY